MDNASPILLIAEWTLTAVSSKERAAEVVGDQSFKCDSFFLSRLGLCLPPTATT
jgi:hypothetical protein